MVESTGLTSDCSIEKAAAAADSTRKVSRAEEVLRDMKILRRNDGGLRTLRAFAGGRPIG
ncbi:hypothetical protein GCM10027176_07590 [Actinoallomurus bryophytorum]